MFGQRRPCKWNRTKAYKFRSKYTSKVHDSLLLSVLLKWKVASSYSLLLIKLVVFWKAMVGLLFLMEITSLIWPRVHDRQWRRHTNNIETVTGHCTYISFGPLVIDDVLSHESSSLIIINDYHPHYLSLMSTLRRLLLNRIHSASLSIHFRSLPRPTAFSHLHHDASANNLVLLSKGYI